MSKKANPAVIGGFVVAAIVIALAGVLVLGSGRFFRESRSYVLHFEGDLSGLDVGAPVTFRGVRIGQVTDVSIVYDHATDDITTPVVVEITRDAFLDRNAGQAAQLGRGMKLHIDRGLRARLASQSLVTGKLKVSLDYFPETEAVYRAVDKTLAEIPTVPGALDSLAQRLSALPFEEIVIDLRESTKGIASLMGSGTLQETLDELSGTLSNISVVVSSTEVEGAISSLEGILTDISEVIRSAEIRQVVTSIDDTLQESQRLMRDVREGAEPLRREVLVALDKLADAARSARSFLDYIDRHPEALIHGKGKEER